MSTYRLMVGDRAVEIEQDPPPRRVREAMKRLEAAVRRGAPPGSGTTAADAAILTAWIEGQERKYPGHDDDRRAAGR